MKLLASVVVVVVMAGLVSGMDVEVKPAVQMRNSVDTYYRNVLPTSSSSSYTFNRLRSKPLLRAKPMVKLAPKKMGSTYFNTFMAVP